MAQLIQCFSVGGIETMVHRLGQSLPEHGVSCEVIAYVADGELRSAMAADGIATTWLPTRDGIKPGLGLELARHLRARRIDVLHSHHLGPFLYGTLAAALSRVPHVHTEHSVELYDVRRRRVAARIMPRLAHVVGVTPAIADWRRRELGGPEIDVIPNGVPIPDALPTADDRASARALAGAEDAGPDGFVVGCVARLAPEKDHATLLEAFAKVVTLRPDARLVLVGDGECRAALTARAERADLVGRVLLLGERHDLDRLYPGFDLAALASTREGLPLAVLEAMGHGQAVVATAVGGLPGLLADGGGVTVSPGDPDALAAAILDYAADPARRARDGEAARRLAETRYGLDAMTSRYVELYERVAGGAP